MHVLRKTKKMVYLNNQRNVEISRDSSNKKVVIFEWTALLKTDMYRTVKSLIIIYTLLLR